MAAPPRPEGNLKVEMTIEPLDELQDIDFEGTPPCTVKRRLTGEWKTCGQPSVARVHCTCTCGYERRVFACEDCLFVMINFPELAVCQGCRAQGTITVKAA